MKIETMKASRKKGQLLTTLFDTLPQLIVVTISFGIFLALTYYSARYTQLFQTYDMEQLTNHTDSAFQNGIFSLLAIVSLVLLSLFIPKNKIVNRILMILFFIFCTGVSFWWVFTSHSFPKGDAAIMYSVAEQIIYGINDTLKEGGYIYIYPQQLGLGAVIELIFRLFGAGNETAFQCLNAALIPVMFFSGFQLTHEIFDDHRIDFYFMILMSTCLPLLLYVPYMYGEISSTTFLFVLALLVKKYSISPKLRYGILGVIIATLAVLVRKNSWIVIIAVLIVLFLHAITQKRLGAILIGIFILLGIFGVDKAIEITYETRTDCQLEEGMPPLLSLIDLIQVEHKQPTLLA